MVAVRIPRIACTALISLSVLALLSACAQSRSAAWTTARHMVNSSSAVDTAQLNPRYRYLRVTTNGEVALLVLGYVDLDALGRPVDVWYTADQEVLRLQNGRLVALLGTPTEWRSVTLPADLPAWSPGQAAYSYLRQRDEMPGYRIGLQERVQVRPVPAPSNSALAQLSPASLQWFEETADRLNNSGDPIQPQPARLPAARYAIAPGATTSAPVYGEQCIDTSFCISWQTWPSLGPKP